MKNGNIKLGLNILLFIASLISIGAGTLVGMVGIWSAAAWGKPVPEWEKVGHAHTSWWSVLIIISAMVLPSLNLKPWVKRLVIGGTFAGPTLWIGVLATYYEMGGPTLWRLEVPLAPATYYELPLLGLVASVLEFLGFLSLLIVGLSASGVNIPLLYSREVQKSKYDILSDVEVPRKIFLLPTLIVAAGVISGFGMTLTFKAPRIPISPAALVQLHDHPVIIATSSLLVLLTLKVLNVGERVFNLGYRLMQISLPLILIGLLAFNFAPVPSFVWVMPAGIYFLLLLLGFPASLGVYSSEKKREGSIGGALDYEPAVRSGMAVSFALLAFLVLVGAYIAVTWDVWPNITVTYKQPEGSPYPGEYPAKYIGTAPVKGTPRGLENAHLSPGSWLHVAIAWLMVLTVVGNQVFGSVVKKPAMVYLYAATMPMAPIFNALGRFLAWLGVPNGIGALWFAGHPIKGFNLISLFVVALVVAYRLSKKADGLFSPGLRPLAAAADRIGGLAKAGHTGLEYRDVRDVL